MVDWKVVENDISIPIIDGVATESFRNPKRDAARWVERERPRVEGFQAVVFLGVGSGLYLKEFNKNFPETEVVVVSKEKILLDNFEKLKLNGIHCVRAANIEDLKSSMTIQRLVRKVFRVLKHPGEFRATNSLYSEFESFLCGRSFESFGWHLNKRPALQKIFRQVALQGDLSGRPLSIVDLKRIASRISGPPSREIKILRALEELIK